MSEIKATLLDYMGSDLTVVNAARVSFGKISDWEVNMEEGRIALSAKDTKLIHYLAKHKHTSPFGHCFASFHVKAPVFVARQLVKHKFLRWNEISRRYVDEDPEFYTPTTYRGRAADKKQGSSSEPILVMEFSNNVESWSGLVDDFVWSHTEGALQLYRSMIGAGICPEQARMVLPLNTMTEWIWSGSLDAFADMCRLRCKPDTQEETRIVADQISTDMAGLFEHSWKALLS